MSEMTAISCDFCKARVEVSAGVSLPEGWFFFRLAKSISGIEKASHACPTCWAALMAVMDDPEGASRKALARVTELEGELAAAKGRIEMLEFYKREHESLTARLRTAGQCREWSELVQNIRREAEEQRAKKAEEQRAKKAEEQRAKKAEKKKRS